MSGAVPTRLAVRKSGKRKAAWQAPAGLPGACSAVSRRRLRHPDAVPARSVWIADL